MGVTRDEEGYTVDLLPVFHKQCAAEHLIAKGRAKTGTPGKPMLQLVKEDKAA